MNAIPQIAPTESLAVRLDALLAEARKIAVKLSLDGGAGADSYTDAAASISDAITACTEAATTHAEAALDQARGHYDLGGAWHGPEEEAA